MVALYVLCCGLVSNGTLKSMPCKNFIAAISAGIVNSQVMVDLDYNEDSSAEIDGNYVMTDFNEFIEVQTTAENGSLKSSVLNEIISVSSDSISSIIKKQKECVAVYKNIT
jgi:ribonuclease PH